MIINLLLLTLFSSGINVEILTAELHIETGMAYLSQGLPDRAFAEFQTALDITDNATEAYLGLARVATINQSFLVAEEHYKHYIETNPTNYLAPLELSKMLLLTNLRSIEALDYANSALELAPLNGECWLVIADAEARLHNNEAAISWYTRLIIENEELADTSRVKLGKLYFEEGDLQKAREILLGTERIGAYRLLALIYLEQNDNLRAIDNINKYLFLNPNGSWADSARTYLDELSQARLH